MAKQVINNSFLVSANVLDDENGQTYDISSAISYVGIKKAYYENAFPLVVIGILSTNKMKNIISNNNVRVSLSIFSYDNESSDGNNEDNEDVYPTSEVLSTIIRPYIKPPFSASAIDEDEDNTSAEIAEDAIESEDYEISGIPEDLIIRNKRVVNEVYQDCSLNEIILNILSKDDENIELVPAHNNEREKNILIPPMSPVQALNFLDNTYGVYRSGLLYFADFNKTFIQPSALGTENFTKTFTVDIKESRNTSDTSIYSKIIRDTETNDLHMYLRNSPALADRSKVLGNEYGKEIVFVSYNDNFDLDSSSQINQSDDMYEKTKYLWNSNSDSIFADRYISEAKKTKGISLSLSAVNPDLINPRTRVSVINSPDEDVNGDYTVAENSFVISTSDFKHYASTMMLTLIKE